MQRNTSLNILKATQRRKRCVGEAVGVFFGGGVPVRSVFLVLYDIVY